MEIEERQISGRLTGSILKKFEDIKSELSQGGLILISDASVIRYLIVKHDKTQKEPDSNSKELLMY